MNWKNQTGFSRLRRRASSVSRLGLVLGALLSSFQPAISDESFLYGVTDLGTLGGANSRASAINENGWVVGESETESGAVRAFLWTPENGMRSLGTLGGANSRALDINIRGVVVGESTTANGETRAFSWSEEGEIQPLAATTQTLFSTAFAINDEGKIVGSLEEPRASHAVVWDGQRFEFLPRFPGSGYVQPLDINDAGDVVGQIQTGADETLMSHAYYFRRALDAKNLAEFKLISPQSGSATVAINQLGEAVGYTVLESARIRAFHYDRTAGLENLQDRQALYSNAAEINEKGGVVGSCIPAYASDEAACAWIGREFFNLNEVTDIRTNWWLVQATGINNAGLISGYGLMGDNDHAFLLTPSPGLSHENWPALKISFHDQPDTNDEARLILLKVDITNDADTRRVIFYANRHLIGSLDQPPYEWFWRCARDQRYEIYAEMTDSKGRRIRSPLVAMENHDAQPDTIKQP